MPALGCIVGEAPGREEVAQGRPFVGRSGKLLDVALRALGVDRSTVYVTNVVKDIPLDSDERIRRPYAEEIAAWKPILDGEILETAPAAILALGRTAANTLTELEGDIPFGSRVGIVYTAWHPSYLLHRGMSGVSKEWLDQLSPWAEALREAEVAV